MKESKLIRILRTFSKNEMRAFEKFAASPYFTKEKNCLPLVKLLKKYYPAFSQKDFTFENIYMQLYPGRNFNKQVMWNLTSAAEKTAEEFLVHHALNNSAEKRFLLLKEFSERKLTGNLNRHITRLRSELEEAEIGRDHFSGLAKLEWAEIESKFLNDNQHKVTENIKRRGENIILHFLMEFSEVVNDLIINLDMYNADHMNSFPVKFARSLKLDEVLEIYGSEGFKYSFIAELYYHWLKTVLDSEDDKHFHSFKRIFFEHENEFTDYEKFNITSALVSHCIRKVREGDKSFRREVFEINDYRLRNGVAFYPKGQMPKNIYKQMYINALMLEETEWVSEFIEKYTPMLLPEMQKPMKSLALAFLNFTLGKYEKVLDNLNKLENLDIRDKTHLKILMAQSYYELGQVETLLNHIDTSKHFFKNNITVNEERKDNYGSFFSILLKLIQIAEKPSGEEIFNLRKEVNSINMLNSKKWILQKLDELENR